MPVVHNRYRITRELSTTLYGWVLLCEDMSNGIKSTSIPESPPSVVIKQVSLKRMTNFMRTQADGHIADNPMMEREVGDLVHAAGCHPNLVQYKCSFVEKHKLYLVMEYCADGDLHDYLTRNSQQKMSWLNVLSVLAQVTAGVAFLHKLGIAHRDISLENIMLHHGSYKLGDFGIATRTWGAGGRLVGKNCYMAPEIVAGSSYDPKAADVWSLGIVVFILLTGSPLVSLASMSVRSFCVFKKAGVERVLQSWGIAVSLPKSALNLLSGMLEINPTKRLTIAQVLEHAALKQ